MAALSIQVPYPVFYDRDGQPIDNGNIYIGVANLDPVTNPIQVYYDEALTITASQPLLTSSGYVYRNGTPTQLYVNANDFSITVNDSKNLLVYNFPTATGIGTGAASIEYDPPFTGAVTSNYSVADKLSQYLSVKDFGAVGNGVANDSAAIVAAMTSASLAKKSVFFPAGTYRLLTHIELISNISFVGEPGSQIFFDPAMTVGTVIGGTARAMYAQNKSNITFENIRLYSSVTSVTKPLTICFENQAGLNLYNCQFDTFGDATYYAQGIILYGSSKIRIDNTRFLTCSGDGAAFSNDCNNISVTSSEFSSNGDWGLALSIGCYDAVIEGCVFKNNISTATGADRCRKIAFIGNTMVNNEHGVRIAEFANTAEYNQQITVIGNNITNVAVAGVSVENLYSPFGLVSVTGNTISGSSNQGIRVINAANVSVTGNAIYSCAADGILFNALDAGFITGLSTVVGNTVDTCTYGIRQLETSGTTTPITVVGNRISNASVAEINGVSPASMDIIDGSKSTSYFNFSKPISIPSAYVSTSATAGSYAVPANAFAFLPIYIDGVQKKIAVYSV